MTIVLADDHTLILNGLSSLLKSSFIDAQIICVTNKAELLNALQNNTVTVLVQDVRFGKDDARDFVDSLKIDYPQLKIVLLTSISDAHSISNMIRLKIDGLILKSETSDQIVQSIKDVLDGNRILPQHNQKLTDNKIELITQLSRREKEVLREILNEKSIKEIANTLYISDKTVEMHRSNLFVKLDVKNVTGLVKKAILLNLLEE
jgi:DNA-binding NarL/FixJ family response regulator